MAGEGVIFSLHIVDISFFLYNGKSCKALIEVISELSFLINSSRLTADKLNSTSIPVILCSFPNRVTRLIKSGQYTPLNLNIRLSEELVKYPVEQRTQRANDEVMSIVSQCKSPTILEDYEILFDPRYNIDAIKVFIEIARHQKVIVKWCGRLNGDSLEYATLDDKDYHSFRIQDYDITCVI